MNILFNKCGGEILIDWKMGKKQLNLQQDLNQRVEAERIRLKIISFSFNLLCLIRFNYTKSNKNASRIRLGSVGIGLLLYQQ